MPEGQKAPASDVRDGPKRNLVTCSRCLYDETVPSIVFDENGVCNYCHLHDEMDRQFPIGEEGQRALDRLADKIRQSGRGKKYDCVVGVSGGCDSSYLVYRMKELGLRPLAVHFDNTWNSPIATQNIHNVLEKLGVDLYTHVVDNKEYDDLYRAFLLSGVREADGPTDIALAATLYRAAEKFGVKYIIEGHSFRTEGISPLGWIYVDGKYIESVHKKYGTRKLKTFPNLKLFDFLRWSAIRNIRRVRPLYYMDYRKEEVKKFLAENLGWQWYGGHHLENRFTAFHHTYYAPRRDNIDMRILGYAALVRSGQMPRDEGFAKLAEPINEDPQIVQMVKKRLGFSDEEFEKVMNLPHREYTEFKTYKRTFERLTWLFWALYKLDRVPKSFYLKYTKRQQTLVK
jgi:N-acetyl sugar amidotransferase